MNETGKNSVLIVDDEKMDIMALTQILSPEYTIYAVKDGQDAIENAKKCLPDVILLDIIMPGMDGYAVIAALKNSEETKNIPVIFITGLGDVDDEKKGLALGAADYITKPFSSTIVKLRIQNQIKIINQTRLLIEKELAEKTSRAKVEFLLRMSHEMLTPMNAIVGMTQIAKMSDGLNKTMKGYLHEIDDAARHLLELINDLFDMSGNGDSLFVLADSAFSINVTFRNILKGIEHDITKKQHTLTCDIDPSIPLLTGDEKRLSRVINNLLENAIKFTPEHGKIHFSVRALNADNDVITLQIEISDNGIGILKEHQSEIFNIFGQVDDRFTGKHGGAGLGLPVSKRIIEKMGGEIWVYSEPDKGSKFTFTCKLRKG